MNGQFQAPMRITVDLADGVLAGWCWPRPGAPRILFLHATGFCASAYRQMLSLAADRFDIRAFDLRGHGRTALPADPKRLRGWGVYARDVGDALDRFDAEEGPSRWTLAGHSCGAVVAVLTAAGRRDIEALALIEPVSLRPLAYLAARTPIWRRSIAYSPMVRGALARRSSWPRRDDVRASYERKALFRDWAEGALDDYLEDGLTEDGEGVRLACAPAWEAATFAGHAHDLWGAVRRAPARVHVLAADHPTSTLRGGAVSRYRRLGATVTMAQGPTHLLPLERPDLAARFIVGAASGQAWSL